MVTEVENPNLQLCLLVEDQFSTLRAAKFLVARIRAVRRAFRQGIRPKNSKC